MSDKPSRVEINCATGEVKTIVLTAKEIAEMDQAAAKSAEERAKREADAQALADLKESAKAKLVAGEKLTEEEASALVI